MNLKEAYQYQNYVGGLFTQVAGYLSYDNNITRKECMHYRSRAAEGANDETTDETVERPFGDIPVDTLIAFAYALINERVHLGAAITDAKYCAKLTFERGIDLDAELSANKSRHQLISKLERMAAIKPETIRKCTGKDYKFNAEGNQTMYVYNTEEKVTIDFDREQLRTTLKQLREIAMEKSMSAEKAMLDTEVQFVPSFDMTDSFSDTLSAFAVSLKSESAE